jgi:hypothetical protein
VIVNHFILIKNIPYLLPNYIFMKTVNKLSVHICMGMMLLFLVQCQNGAPDVAPKASMKKNANAWFTIQCTYTQGYWKTHGVYPTGNNSNEWPVTSLTLGTVLYTDVELLAILKSPVQGNGLLSLAHQLIAAKLNIANGSSNTAIATTITAADALIGNLVIPPVGTGYLSPATTSALTTALANYNEGVTGPGHCN